MTTIKEWVETGMETNAPANTHVIRDRHNNCHIVNFDVPTIKEMKNRPGFIITFLVTRAIYNSSTNRFQCWTKYAKCLVFKNDYGMRAMWKVGQFGRFGKESTLMGFYPVSLPRTIGLRDDSYAFMRYVREYMADTFPTKEVFPLLKYLEYSESRLGGANWMSYLNYMEHGALTAGPGTKHALNWVYDNKGVKRLPKTAFGGIGEIRSLDQLRGALAMVRIFKNCDPHVFKDMPIINEAHMQGNIGGFRYLLAFFRHTDKAVNMVVRTMNSDDYWTNDTVRMLKQIRKLKVRQAFRDALRRNPDMTMEELHHMVMTEFRRQSTVNRRISSKELNKFDGAAITPEIKSVTPKCTHDLVTWGAEYNICIGSYADRVLNGQTKCFGFQKPDGSFWGFAEVNNQGQLTQLLGKHNQPVPSEQREQIIKWLKGHKVNCEHYWGSSDR